VNLGRSTSDGSGHPINAATIPREDVLLARDGDRRPQNRPEQVEFGRTEPLTCGCGGANRTVVLDEEKPAAVIPPHVRHVPLVGAHACGPSVLRSFTIRRRLWLMAYL
jgi:hypothetical protein